MISILLAAALHLDGDPEDWARTLSGEPLRAAPLDPVLRIVAQEPAGARKDHDLQLNFAAHVRYAIPFGAADRSEWVYGPGIVVVDQNLSWADFFNPGWGLDLEVDIFFSGRGAGQNQTPGTNYGVMFMLQTDEFGGERVNGIGNNSVKADDLTMNSILVGGKVLHTLGGGFYADGHVAIGAVHYLAVDATFTGGFAQFRDEIFDDTWTFASQFRGHVGYRAGPVGFVLGLGFRIQAPPSEGGRVSFDSGAFWTFDLELGVELGF